MRQEILGFVLLAACATRTPVVREADSNGDIGATATAPDERVSPVTANPNGGVGGTLFRRDDSASPMIELRLLEAVSMPSGWPDADAPFVIARTAAELLEAGVTSQEPIDFARWLALIPTTSSGNARVLLAKDLPGEVQLGYIGDELQVRYQGACSFCGGSASVQQDAEVCLEKLGSRILLIPRPPAKLVVGFVDQRCDPALP